MIQLLFKKVKSLYEIIIFIFVSPIPKKDFIIVTGADSSHYKSLKQLLSSIYLYESTTKTLVFNLGLTQLELNELKNKFKTIEIRKFNYSKYPKYFNININAGEYAWKPVIIANVLNEFKCSICWMDAGNVLISPLTTIKKLMNFKGFYSPYSKGKIYEWTLPRSLSFLKTVKKILNKNNLNGACIAVNYKNNTARKVINKWKECIAPTGSNRTNHRQDQAILSVLAHQYKITNKIFNEYYGFKTHQDIDK